MLGPALAPAKVIAVLVGGAATWGLLGTGDAVRSQAATANAKHNVRAMSPRPVDMLVETSLEPARFPPRLVGEIPGRLGDRPIAMRIWRADLSTVNCRPKGGLEDRLSRIRVSYRLTA